MTQCECLVIVRAAFLLRLYLEECPCTVRTYQDTLRCISNLTNSTGKLTLWKQRLPELEFDVEHCTKIKGKVADTLSRLIKAVAAKTTNEDDIPVPSITLSNLPQKEEAKFIYMQHDDGEIDKPGVRLSNIYTLQTATERNNRKRPIAAQEFIDE